MNCTSSLAGSPRSTARTWRRHSRDWSLWCASRVLVHEMHTVQIPSDPFAGGSTQYAGSELACTLHVQSVCHVAVRIVGERHMFAVQLFQPGEKMCGLLTGALMGPPGSGRRESPAGNTGCAPGRALPGSQPGATAAAVQGALPCQRQQHQAAHGTGSYRGRQPQPKHKARSPSPPQLHLSAALHCLQGTHLLLQDEMQALIVTDGHNTIPTCPEAAIACYKSLS